MSDRAYLDYRVGRGLSRTGWLRRANVVSSRAGQGRLPGIAGPIRNGALQPWSLWDPSRGRTTASEVRILALPRSPWSRAGLQGDPQRAELGVFGIGRPVPYKKQPDTRCRAAALAAMSYIEGMERERVLRLPVPVRQACRRVPGLVARLATRWWASLEGQALASEASVARTRELDAARLE